ncbi:type II toxin-antitoxin system RelE/ParE family toxin [Blautia producta]|nr:type II toxin-antitoxin system RelE/ParE family toxin [Blautia producta]NSG15219.1 type II toxin-antitoxin system RelE/ParE family toxin [Blautia producta]NSJ75411.1 type II toxin-antitoxin system RelE/ParE family toxin [Blautia producta]
MNYNLHITLTAEKDITHAADYIEFVLKNPQAADHLLDETEREISDLSQFPKRHPLVEDKILASWGVRFTQVGNYLAFYTISEDDMQINIIRFLYAKSDWNSILKLGFSLI